MKPPQVFVHDGLGRQLGVVRSATSIDRSWRIKGVSQARFLCAASDAAGTLLDPLQGRAVRITSEHYPLTWVGAITAVERMPSTGQYDVSCIGLEGILAQRYIGVDSYGPGSAESILRAICDDVDAENGTGLACAPDMASGPDIREPIKFPNRSFFGALDAIAQKTGYEWWVESDGDEQGITARIQYQPARGARSSLVLTEGRRCDVMRERIDGRGTYARKLVGGQTSVTQAYTERARASVLSGNVTPARRHGYEYELSDLSQSPLTRRERLAHAEEVTAQGAVQQAAVAEQEIPRAERVMDLHVYENDSTWKHLLPGNVVGFTSTTANLGAGWTGGVAIERVEPKEEMGDLVLTVRGMGADRG